MSLETDRNVGLKIWQKQKNTEQPGREALF